MKGTALTRFTLWLAIFSFVAFAGIEARYHNFDNQSMGTLLFRIILYNLCFLMLGISISLQREPGRIYRIMRLISLTLLILLSAICHYFLITHSGEGVGVLFLMFVFISGLTVLSLELVAWNASRKASNR